MIGAMKRGSGKAEKSPETVLHWMIECPEINELAEADVSASSAIFFPSRRFRIEDCSRWPERETCQQICLKSHSLASSEYASDT